MSRVFKQFLNLALSHLLSSTSYISEVMIPVKIPFDIQVLQCQREASATIFHILESFLLYLFPVMTQYQVKAIQCKKKEMQMYQRSQDLKIEQVHSKTSNSSMQRN